MKPSMAVGTALLLCAAFGTARAEEPYEPADTAGPVVLGPAVIEEEREREAQAAARVLAERRQRMIEECEDNFGSEVDCRRETDTELRAEGLQ